MIIIFFLKIQFHAPSSLFINADAGENYRVKMIVTDDIRGAGRQGGRAENIPYSQLVHAFKKRGLAEIVKQPFRSRLGREISPG